MLPTSPISPTLHTRPHQHVTDNLNLHTNKPTKQTEIPTLKPNDSENLDPQKDTVPYFSKWSRQQVLRAMANGDVYSLYIQNLSHRWSPMELYRIMSKHREVVDVYILRKKASNGRRFGFVRFRSNCDLNRLLSDINRVQVEDGMVSANIVKERGSNLSFRQTHPVVQQAPKGERRTFAEVVRGETGVEVRDPNRLDEVQLAWKRHDRQDVTVSLLGGICGVVQIALETLNRTRLDVARVQILTTIRGFLNRDVTGIIGGITYPMFVVEDGDSDESPVTQTGREEISEAREIVSDSQAINIDPLSIAEILQPRSRGGEGKMEEARIEDVNAGDGGILASQADSTGDLLVDGGAIVGESNLAVKAARVILRKKYKRLTKTGDIVSADSSTNEDIRRVNTRLSQQVHTSPKMVSFSEEEARETVKVGDELGWVVSGSAEEVMNMGKELVEQEAVEWSASRVNV
ncbi:hypothetical protein Tsubulata_027933 [Turnera subulata]|uniref:RRM domain-containing protein n=1 Tax=Turnera subulata TaxID=218843 RepID=A0A9Q0FE66_9ROSI|nr:hypothetical protein Tsubulata_027933 [Turnera subulata]